MDEKRELPLHERVDQLEILVKDLRERLEKAERLQPQSQSSVVPEPPQTGLQSDVGPDEVSRASTPPPPQRPPTKRANAFTLPEHMRRSDYWLNKVGIGLVLFAVVFLFKYSIDQGWLTPSVRIGFGVALGIALEIVGLRIHAKRRHFSQVLIGGGIATFYITGFSAFQIFELVPFAVAMAFMVAVTVFCFFLSLKQNEAVLSLLGAIGGLATPFLLYTGSGNIPGLIAYTCMVLAGTGAIYFFKGWRSLLWVSVIGGWIVIGVALSSTDLDKPFDDQIIAKLWAIQCGVIFAWLSFWALPVLRNVVCLVNPDKWTRGTLGFADSFMNQNLVRFLNQHVHALTISTALIALVMFMDIWSLKFLSDETMGWIIMGFSMVYFLVGWHLRRLEPLKTLAYTHAVVGTLVLTISLALLLDGNALLIALATEMAALHLISRRMNDRGTSVMGNFLFGFVMLWLLFRISYENQSGTAVFNAKALSDCWALVMAFAASRVARTSTEKSTYLIIGSAVLAGLFWRELDGDLLFFVLTAQAAALHLVAMWLKDKYATMAAHSFLVILVVYFVTERFWLAAESPAMLNIQALADIFLIVALAALAVRVIAGRDKLAYYLASHAILLALFFREFSPLENGQGYVSIAWGVYAVALLILGLRLNYDKLRIVALATLLVVVGKLFIVDLAHLETIWRILLFFGFGGMFLLISYYFRSLWKVSSEQKNTEDETD